MSKPTVKIAAVLGVGADKLQEEASDIALIQRVKAYYAKAQLNATVGELEASEGTTDLVGTSEVRY